MDLRGSLCKNLFAIYTKVIQINLLAWQNCSIHKCKMLLKPGVFEVVNVKMPLDKEYVLEERSGGVAAVSYSFIQGPICHFLQENYGFLHDG